MAEFAGPGTAGAEAPEKVAIRVEHAHTVAEVLDHVDPRAIGRDAEIDRVPELPGTGPEGAERAHGHERRRELLNPIVELICDEDIARAIEHDPARNVELPGAGAVRTKLGEVLPVRRIHDDPMV